MGRGGKSKKGGETGRELERVSQSMEFREFLSAKMASPSLCRLEVASSEKEKEGGKVTGFGIRTSVVTLELFRDLHASVFGYVEDEGIVEEKFLACLSFSV